jgi:hypothetical protein
VFVVVLVGGGAVLAAEFAFYIFISVAMIFSQDFGVVVSCKRREVQTEHRKITVIYEEVVSS